MKQLHIVHRTRIRGGHGSSHQGGDNEFWLGPYALREAKVEKSEHETMDKILRTQGNGPKACRTTVEPFVWKKEWDDRPERVEICTPGCSGCRHGFHNEVRDAA